MNKGIRIKDTNIIGKTKVVCVELKDILEEVQNGNQLFWSILFLDAVGFIGGSEGIPDFDKIRISKRGLLISWKDLNVLATRFEQIIDLHLIGSYDLDKINRYSDEQEYYNNCDLDILMFDSSYWEVFSKDENLIKKLSEKFKDIDILSSELEN